MSRWPVAVALVVMTLFLQSCGPSAGTGRPEPAMTAEGLYARGHEEYVERNLDSAAALFRRAVAIDSGYVPALTELADVQYELGMRAPGEDNPERLAMFRAARTTLVRLESLGSQESGVYERICELSVALDDNRTFLKYAKKNADKYPYDRQMYNLGLAYYQTGDYAAAVKVTRQGTEKFRQSPYIGGMYRTLGLSYMKQDRDQTATRVLESGLASVDSRIAELKKAGTGSDSPDLRRLTDDRVALLATLRKLYTTYNDRPKLEHVERLLREAGELK